MRGWVPEGQLRSLRFVYLGRPPQTRYSEELGPEENRVRRRRFPGVGRIYPSEARNCPSSTTPFSSTESPAGFPKYRLKSTSAARFRCQPSTSNLTSPSFSDPVAPRASVMADKPDEQVKQAEPGSPVEQGEENKSVEESARDMQTEQVEFVEFVDKEEQGRQEKQDEQPGFTNLQLVERVDSYSPVPVRLLVHF